MFQNIKTDIIYHKTATDFEMEFNLCGCCRMRLLTDKSPDNKIFVHNLARAVSRSKIIIITGNLFGNDGIIKIASQAISKKLEVIDNAQYNINSTEEISVIKSSTPLVSRDGYFGGCIIESGPQTMVLISDNKNIRKDIMQTLIHPYIKEVYTSDANSAPENDNSAVTEDLTDDTLAMLEKISSAEIPSIDDFSAPSATLETSDISLEEFEPAHLLIENEEDEKNLNNLKNTPSDFSLNDEEESSSEDDDAIILNDDDEDEELPRFEEKPYFTKPKKYDDSYNLISEEEDFNFGPYNANPLEVEGSGIISDDDYVDYMFKKRFRLDLPILIISLIILIILAIVAYFIVYLPLKHGVSAIEYTKNIFSTLFNL